MQNGKNFYYKNILIKFQNVAEKKFLPTMG